MDPAAEARPDVAPPRLRLTFLGGSRRGSFVELSGAVSRVGRAVGSSVWLPDEPAMAQQQAKFVRLEDGFVLIDLDTGQTFANGRAVERHRLRDGDLVTFGRGGPRLEVQVLAADTAARASPGTVVIPNFAALANRRSGGTLVRELPIEGDDLLIGRREGADVRLDSPIVSREHARIRRLQGELWVEDLDSSNGSYLDGQTLAERAVLRHDSRLVVGPFQLRLQPGAPPRLQVLDTRNRARLDALGLGLGADGRRLLDDVSLTLAPGSFTAIIGPSGSGKSTLLRALSGAAPAIQGQVLVNGADLYRHHDEMKAGVGHVPQDDIVHHELTVQESLDYTARLRLPPDTTAAERARRIADVLGLLELSERRDLPIERLSGGQRKRVSIATELITEPSLLFLDEPTSGLDPGLEEALMLLLRELSYKGKTVAVVTHTLDNLHLVDDVALLCEGRLVFFGPAREARARFGLDHLGRLYSRLKEKPAEQWRSEFVAGEANADGAARLPREAPTQTREVPRHPSRGAGGLRQAGILTARYLRSMGRDVRNAGLLLAQAPLVAGLIGLSLLYGPADVAYAKPTNTLLFLAVLSAFWFGCSNAARELVKERAIYLRERRVNLRIVPYLASKLVVLGGLAGIQCLVLLGILDTWFGLPGRATLLISATLLAAATGIALGLALSALARTADRAMTLLPLLLIPQVLFTSPAVQMDMKGPASVVARAMPTWWAYDLLRRVALEPDEALDDDDVFERARAGQPVMLTRARLERMVQEGYLLLQHRSALELTWTASYPERIGRHVPASLGRWRPAVVDGLVLSGMSLALLTLAGVALRRLDRSA